MKNIFYVFIFLLYSNVLSAQRLLHAPELLYQASNAKVELSYFKNNSDYYEVITLTRLDKAIDTIAVLRSDNDTSVLKSISLMTNLSSKCDASRNPSHQKYLNKNVFYTDTTFSFAAIKMGHLPIDLIGAIQGCSGKKQSLIATVFCNLYCLVK